MNETPIYLQHYNNNCPMGDNYINITENKLNHISDNINLSINNTYKKVTQGPSVSKLSCLIHKGKINEEKANGCGKHNSKNMYQFNKHLNNEE